MMITDTKRKRLLGDRFSLPSIRRPHAETEYLYDTIRLQQLDLELLKDLDNLLFGAKNIEMFFNKLSTLLKKKLECKCLYIWLKSEKDENKGFLANSKPGTHLKLYRQNSHVGIVGQVMKTGKMIVAQDVSKNPHYFKLDPKTKSQLTVPLFDENLRCMGVLSIESSTKDFFKQSAIDMISSISPTISHAIEEARLYQAVLVSERKYKNLIGTMTEAMWVGNKDGRTEFINANFEKIFGYSREELSQKPFYEFFYGNSGESVKNAAKKMFAKICAGHNWQYSMEVPGKSGEIIPMFINCSPTQAGGVLAVITDLREMKKRDAKISLLETEEKFLITGVQNSMDAIVSLDSGEIIKTWNLGAEKMYGYSPKEAIGKSINLIVPHRLSGKEEHDILIEILEKEGFVGNFETERLKAGGEAIKVSLSCTAIKDDQGAIVGYVSVYRDITQRKIAEQQLQDRLEKMQAAYMEMGRQRRYIDYLSELMDMANLDIAPKEVCEFVVKAVVTFSGADAATLRVYHPESEKMELVACTGVSHDWWGNKIAPLPGSCWERAMKLQKPIKVLDIEKEPAFTSAAMALKNNLHSSIVMPLMAGGSFIGTLTLYSSKKQTDYYSAFNDDISYVFAQQVAVILKGMNL